ncbi:Helicase IV [Corynebacterium occultum]|uniref:Helicase IV n=1 Tax=Corynebacterium occultum TaxID=2675219 RepID=A0A6B8W7H1_9CORY|nr:UvrD-helicase domain-containing protein [Corynebacterium occultum]QGU07245.1 Helicase IV [Corynebacterium occultum]
MAAEDELKVEQEYIDDLFARLDDEVTQANARLQEVMLRVDPSNPDPEALVQRETEYHGLNARLDRLNIAQLGLVFGRIDVATDDMENPVPGSPGLDRRYIGRMGLLDREDGYRTLLLDWRADQARPFYLATTANPEGVHVRRHIRTQGRKVLGVDDEFLAGESAGVERTGVGSESALYRAMQQARSGHMRNIVETIQREQDQIIRDATRGVMVVQGGPGTGKTAVALHRVAYLLYTHRDQLAKTGVLIIGPNRTFLDYISRVLPELGETGVVLSTLGEFYPGVSGTAPESLLAREIKGSAEMVEILREAVKDRQVLPDSPVELRVDSLTLLVDVAMVKAARTRARRSRQPHNDARKIFREHLLEQLAQQLAQKIGADPLGGKNLLSRADIDQLHDDLAEEYAVADLLDEFWPELEPTEVLRGLLEDQEAIARAAHDYDEETQAALYREPGSRWTPSDAALLDELAVLIGIPDPEQARAAAEAAHRELIEDAQDALDILSSSDSTDNDDDQYEAEILSAHDVIDAETLAQRQEVRDIRSTADRARLDHTWAYGHVIIDEAQELSPMDWRMVMRRSPSRWMTLVGDTAQTGSPAGVDSWEEALEPYVKTRFRHHELSVNYRTPAEIMVVANQILARIDPTAQPATAIRESGVQPEQLPADHDPWEVAARRLAEDAERLVAIILPQDHNHARSKGADPAIQVLGVNDIKGLEFDHVIVVDPLGIIEQSPQGWQDLYVAVTRATQTLSLIGEIPQPAE